MKEIVNGFGVRRQINDTGSYIETSEGFIIPTASGGEGKQMNVDSTKAVPMVIDPGYHGDTPVVIDRSRLNHNIMRQAAGKNAVDAYNFLATAQTEKRDEDVTTKKSATKKTVVKKTTTAPLQSQSKPNRSRYAPPEEKKAVQKLEHHSRIDDDLEEPVNVQESAHVDIDALKEEIIAFTKDQLLDSLHESIAQVIESVESQKRGTDEQAPLSGGLVPAPPVAPGALNVAPPSYVLTLTLQKGAEGVMLGGVSLRFHEIVITSNAVVCVYDNRFEYGDRLTPPGTPKDIFEAVVRKSSGDAVENVPQDLCVSYLGIRFSHGSFDYSLFARRKAQ